MKLPLISKTMEKSTALKSYQPFLLAYFQVIHNYIQCMAKKDITFEFAEIEM